MRPGFDAARPVPQGMAATLRHAIPPRPEHKKAGLPRESGLVHAVPLRGRDQSFVRPIRRTLPPGSRSPTRQFRQYP